MAQITMAQKFDGTGHVLANQTEDVTKYSKFMSYTLEDKTVTRTKGGCYIKGSDGAKLINMQKVDNNLHNEASCKLNAAKKQSIDKESNMNNSSNENNVYYSLVERDEENSKRGYFYCYLSKPQSSEIEKSSNEVKEVTIWKAFNENEKHLIQKGNYAYYRNGALFICDKQGKVLKQMGNTIDSSQDYYLLNDSEKICYTNRYTDIR